MNAAQPQKEHQWLQKLVGNWTYETGGMTAPGTPPEKSTGAEIVRSIGGLWVLCEGHGEMPGGGMATSIITLGYDPAKKTLRGHFHRLRDDQFVALRRRVGCFRQRVIAKLRRPQLHRRRKNRQVQRCDRVQE